MRAFTSGLYAKMSEEMKQLFYTSDNVLQRAEQSYHIVERTLEELKEFILNYMFKDKQEEISFFKEIKPMFLQELIYYMEVFQLESWKPTVGKDEVIAHYGLGAKRVDFYLKRYNELYTYYRKGSCLYDERYFLRGKSGNDLITPISLADIDPRFSTVYSFQFAKMQAYEQFSKYLQQCIYDLEHPEAAQAADESEGHKATWTDTKVDLIELGYGIFAKDSINNGNANLKLIMTVLGKAFNIDLGNYYGVIQQNIRLRKLKERTHYLNSMIECAERKMDDLDDDPVRS